MNETRLRASSIEALFKWPTNDLYAMPLQCNESRCVARSPYRPPGRADVHSPVTQPHKSLVPGIAEVQLASMGPDDQGLLLSIYAAWSARNDKCHYPRSCCSKYMQLLSASFISKAQTIDWQY
jgi:hypothetical protein